ncbi:MAG: hypothetical protein ABIA78_00770 [archaeon]
MDVIIIYGFILIMVGFFAMIFNEASSRLIRIWTPFGSYKSKIITYLFGIVFILAGSVLLIKTLFFS